MSCAKSGSNVFRQSFPMDLPDDYHVDTQDKRKGSEDERHEGKN
jgi:hypothetical protein